MRDTPKFSVKYAENVYNKASNDVTTLKKQKFLRKCLLFGESAEVYGQQGNNFRQKRYGKETDNLDSQ